MGLKTYNPTSPGRRGMSGLDFADIAKKEPEKSLSGGLKKTGGRNVYGRITCWNKGGGHKRKIRIIDFKRDKIGMFAKVKSIEYDPNRSARIALIQYLDGEKSYILAPSELKVNDSVISSSKADIKPGNCLPLKVIPSGTLVHNVELVPQRGGQIIRSAGGAAQVMAKEGKYVLLKLPSGELRKFHENCRASIGQVSNIDHENISIGKAGRGRWLGRRPRSRGVVMNPIDHPLGGGEGKSSGGRHPCSPWGKPAKGAKTRKKKPSDKFIVKRRK